MDYPVASALPEEPRQGVRVERPLGVTVVACFQIAKAAILILTGTLLRLRPETVTSSKSLLYPLLYIAMRGNAAVVDAALKPDSPVVGILSGIIAVLGIYLGAIGFGLLQLKAWARRSVMLTCAMTIVFFAKSTFFPSASAAGSSTPAPATPDMINFYILLAFDALVFVYFAKSDRAELFKNSTESYMR